MAQHVGRWDGNLDIDVPSGPSLAGLTNDAAVDGGWIVTGESGVRIVGGIFRYAGFQRQAGDIPNPIPTVRSAHELEVGVSRRASRSSVAMIVGYLWIVGLRIGVRVAGVGRIGVVVGVIVGVSPTTRITGRVRVGLRRVLTAVAIHVALEISFTVVMTAFRR
jgi:hypothetical protein